MKNFATTIASIAMIAQIVAFPASALAASTDLQITGNGAESTNSTAVTSNSNTVVSQNNNADITNNVNASSSTGSNKASKNTGGDVSVDTGNSKTLVSVENAANSNTANVTNCNCDTDATVKISGNGADSSNSADLTLTNKTQVAQRNSGDVENKVNASSNTGDNKASSNTGGDVEVSTGDAFTHVDLMTHANSNAAQVGGNGNGGSNVSLMIAGNGADSDNSIWLALDHDTVLQQYNSSSVENDVDATATTGENKADRNTGGGVSIDTGNAHTGVAVDNAANFNWANIDCDCLTAVTAKVADNGTESDNTIGATLSDDQNVFQDNSCGTALLELDWNGWNKKCGIDNDLYADSATGVNSLKSNTADPGEDPEIMTGNSETLVGVQNAGNSNVFGTPMETPEVTGGTNVNISFNLGDLLSALGIH